MQRNFPQGLVCWQPWASCRVPCRIGLGILWGGFHLAHGFSASLIRDLVGISQS